MKKFIYLLVGITLIVNSTAIAQGTVGINTETPKTTLDIVQPDKATNAGHGFRLDDGNQALGRFLRSDADGIGTWQVFDFPTGYDPEPYTALDGWTITSQNLVYYGNLVTVRARFLRTGLPITATPAAGLIIGNIKSAYAPLAYANVSAICPIMLPSGTIIDNPGIIASCLSDTSVRIYFPTRMSITVNTNEIVFITLTYIHL